MNANDSNTKADPISQNPPITLHEKPAEIKAKLVHFFRASGHVAEHGAEALAEGAIQIAFGGKFGE